jgi:carboxylesterase type B
MTDTDGNAGWPVRQGPARVERNIGAFGGDPEAITVGGQSAGAFSSTYLAASPTTGPLIKRVVTQSAPLGLESQDPATATGHGRRFVEILGPERQPPFAPRIKALTAVQARTIAAGQIASGADRYDQTAARLQNAAPSEVLTELDTEIVFRDGTLAVADHQAAAGYASYVYQGDYVPADDPAHIRATTVRHFA